MEKQKKPRAAYLVCIDNDGYEASLELRKLYRTAPAESNDPPFTVRVVDESGEDYLYAASRFVPVDLPPKVRKALAAV